MIQPKKVFRTKEGKLGFEWNDGSRTALNGTTVAARLVTFANFA